MNPPYYSKNHLMIPNIDQKLPLANYLESYDEVISVSGNLKYAQARSKLNKLRRQKLAVPAGPMFRTATRWAMRIRYTR